MATFWGEIRRKRRLVAGTEPTGRAFHGRTTFHRSADSVLLMDAIRGKCDTDHRYSTYVGVSNRSRASPTPAEDVQGRYISSNLGRI